MKKKKKTEIRLKIDEKSWKEDSKFDACYLRAKFYYIQYSNEIQVVREQKRNIHYIM